MGTDIQAMSLREETSQPKTVRVETNIDLCYLVLLPERNDVPFFQVLHWCTWCMQPPFAILGLKAHNVSSDHRCCP